MLFLGQNLGQKNVSYTVDGDKKAHLFHIKYSPHD